MTDKNKKDANNLPSQESDAFRADLSHFGYLLPTNGEEEEVFEKIYGSTQVLMPDRFKTPDFLFEDKSKSKLVSLNASEQEQKAAKPAKGKSATVKLIAKNTYFKRLVLSAEIANQLYEEPTFGHVKFVKVQFLCEQLPQMDINTNYGQYAAGPLDTKNIYSIDNEFKKRKWFTVMKTRYGGYKYVPAENIDDYKKYYANYFSNQIDKINHIIELFRKEKTDFCEIVATLFAVWDRRLQYNTSGVTDAELYKDFYAWSEEKAKFKENQLFRAIGWMKENGIVPAGAQ